MLDFGALYDLRTSAHYAEVAEWLPGTVFRSIGLGVVSKVWGGLLAGLPADKARSSPEVSGSASVLITFQIGLFTDPAQFKREMDEFDRQLAGAEMDLSVYLPSPDRVGFVDDYEVVAFDEALRRPRSAGR